MKRFLQALCVLAFCAPFAMLGQTPQKLTDKAFLLDQSKPYVYLTVEHIGPRIPRNDSEPRVGVWLRLHNNCRLAIRIGSFGVPPGSPATESGVEDRVVPNAQLGTVAISQGANPSLHTVPQIFGGEQAPHPNADATLQRNKKPMPLGYWFDVASTTTILPGQSVYFSLPIDQVSAEWHVEVPFDFDLHVRSSLTEPESYVSLYEDDLQNAKR